MVPLGVLLATALFARSLGIFGVGMLDSWPSATRLGIAAMLLATSSAHFTSLRHDLAKMVPTWIPRPAAVVAFTGVCEVLAAVGLLVPITRGLAAKALIVFFVAVFPANVRAARQGIALGDRPVTPLWLRTPMQAVFVGLTWWAGVAN
ncbi:MAG: DoxX family protein [Gemmatimonadales bacterium]